MEKYEDDFAARKATVEKEYADIMREARSREEFRKALGDFVMAGWRLVDAWDDGEGWNADGVAPLPERIRPPLSLDEWLSELSAHYEEALS